MSKTFRELTAVTPVISTHIMAVSREDTAFAFKTDINDIKNYVLTSGGTIAVFSEVTVPVLRTSSTEFILYVNTTTQAAKISSSSGLEVERVTGLTTGTNYIDLGATSIDFSIASTVVAKIDANSIQHDRFQGYTTGTTFIDLGATIEFYIGSVVVAEIDTDGLGVDQLKGRTIINNYIKFNDTTSSVGIYSGGNLALRCLPTGEIKMPNRSVFSAYGDSGQPIGAGPVTKILFEHETLDPLSQYNATNSMFTMLRAGVKMQFTLQLMLASYAFSVPAVFFLAYSDSTGTYSSASTRVYSLTATYAASFKFTGVFTSVTSAQYFTLLHTAAPTINLDAAYIDVIVLQ